MKFKGFWLRMVPVFVLIAATVILSVNVYTRMINTETEVCWNRLEIATDSTAEKISTRINDNLNFLDTVTDAYIITHNIDDLDAVGRYIDSVAQKTIFERIDVILPDETIITQEGEHTERGGKSSYAELAAKGAHITPRLTSSFTGEEVICCVAPIENNGEAVGILVGTISCSTMSDIFEVFTYGQEVQLFLIDRADGEYIMDNWHDELGNIKDIGLRKSAEGGEMIDMVPAILNGERARFAFISQTNGVCSYQYSAPVEGLNWTVCVVVQEDVVFANVNKLEAVLIKVGITELIVVVIYLLWNIFMNITATKSEAKVRQLEYDRAKNAARANFISNMSHDIKTPLNGIVGMLEVIKNHRREAETVDDCLQKIEISAQYLSTLTSDMLDISEIEGGKLEMPEAPMDLRHVADELTTIMERQAGDGGVSWSVDCSGLSEPHIIGSAVHIKRILVNLCGNAIKYSRYAGKNVWVTISDKATDEPGRRMYRFVIKDNGIGMSEEFQQNMYKAFEQENIDARSEYQGYGLGLTIVSYLVKRMNGSIGLESVKGLGSTFTVSIPFAVAAGEQSKIADKAEEADVSGLCLLLAEDNELNMEIARTLLADAGAVVDTAVNGKLAVDMFAASGVGEYDTIIMDVMMPVMDGCEAAEAIRGMDRPDASAVPIIAMTASTFSEDIARCMASGMNAHVPKPLDLELLLATIRGLCSNSK